MKSTILFITLPNLIESTNHRINNHAELTSHPQLMIEGAFSHAPFDGTSYGFRTKSARYVIPDIDGSNHGQSTWVDIAMCCAATPLSGLSSRDDAHGEAFAPPLANRCLSYQEHASGVTYKDGINPKGINKSPCAAQNVGFYHDLTRDDYHPRHGACCAWFKTFLNDAWTEYPDLKSKNIIDRLNDDGETSIYEKSKNLVKSYDVWRENECGGADQTCCAACLSNNIPNKLNKYIDTNSITDPNTGETPDGPSNNLCSYFGDGWCSVDSNINVAAGGESKIKKILHSIILQNNPSIMVDGAFRHRPTHGDMQGGEPGHVYTTDKTTTETVSVSPSKEGVQHHMDQMHVTVKVPVDPDAIPYITGHGGPELTIPEHSGAVTGQMSWVDIAKCCAATPVTHGGSSSEPSERCVTSDELKVMKKEYNNHKSPCKSENLGWYEHKVHGKGQPLWVPRYQECCEYMKHFIVNGAKEFSDPSSLRILTSVQAAGRTVLGDSTKGSITSMSIALITQYNLWNKGICTDVQGRSTGRCCYDCLRPTINKLNRYSGYDSLLTCGQEGEGWCGVNQKVPHELLEEITATDPVTQALKSEIKQGEENVLQGGKSTVKIDRTKIKIKTKTSFGESVPKKNIKNTKNTSKPKTKAKGKEILKKKKETLPRLLELQTTSKNLEERAEKILIKAHSTKKNLDAGTLDIVDRAKLTLLSERVSLMKMVKEEKEGTLKIEDEKKMKNYRQANDKLPDLLGSVETFVESGQSNSLLEEEEEN